jgi:hypothetical protein
LEIFKNRETIPLEKEAGFVMISAEPETPQDFVKPLFFKIGVWGEFE